jgi:Cytochrome oxidase complex assembly protein 1
LVATSFVTEVEGSVEQNQPPPPSKPRSNWWTRNWKWFVPTGCLTILVLFLVFVGSIVVIVFGAIKSTDPYRDAFARARMHPVVIEALGSPIKEGFFVSGNTNVQRRSRRSKSRYSDLRSKRERYDLRKGGEVARALELLGLGCRNSRAAE